MKTLKLIAILAGIILIPVVFNGCSSEENVLMGETIPPDAPTKNIYNEDDDGDEIEPSVPTSPSALVETPETEPEPEAEGSCNLTISSASTDVATVIAIRWRTENAASGRLLVGTDYFNLTPVAHGATTQIVDRTRTDTFKRISATITTTSGGTKNCTGGMTVTIPALQDDTPPPQAQEDLVKTIQLHIATAKNRDTISNAGTTSILGISICPTSNFNDHTCIIANNIPAGEKVGNLAVGGGWSVTVMASDPDGADVDTFSNNSITHVTFTHPIGVEESMLKRIKITGGADALFFAGMRVYFGNRLIYRNPYIFQWISTQPADFANVHDEDDVNASDLKPSSVKFELGHDFCFKLRIGTADSQYDGTNGPVFLQIGVTEAAKELFLGNNSPDKRNLSRGNSFTGGGTAAPYLAHYFDFDNLYNIHEDDFQSGYGRGDSGGDDDDYIFYINGLDKNNRMRRMNNDAPILRISNNSDDFWQIEDLEVQTFNCKCGSPVYTYTLPGSDVINLSEDEDDATSPHWPENNSMGLSQHGSNCDGSNFSLYTIFQDD